MPGKMIKRMLIPVNRCQARLSNRVPVTQLRPGKGLEIWYRCQARLSDRIPIPINRAKGDIQYATDARLDKPVYSLLVLTD